MDDHSVAGQLSILASQVNNLAVAATGEESRKLLSQQDALTQLALKAISAALDAKAAAYAKTFKSLKDAIASAEKSIGDIANVEDTISRVTKAINLATKLLTAVA